MPIGKEINNNSNQPCQTSKESNEDISFKVEDPVYAFEDLILNEKTQTEIKELSTLKDNLHKLYESWGFKNTHKHEKRVAVNLYGPPGTGKTMAAHAIAKSQGKKVIIVNYADIESKYVGDTPKNIKKLFEFAAKEDAIIFFDEADNLLSKRVIDTNNASSVNINQTRSVLLIELNKTESMVLFATNFVESYDEAFIRRMMKNIEFSLPGLDIRQKIFEKYIPNELPISFDIHHCAQVTDGFSAADISNIVFLSALRATQLNANEVNFEHIEAIIDSVRDTKIKTGTLPLPSEEEISEVIKQEAA